MCSDSDTHAPSVIANAWKLLKCGSWHCAGITHAAQSAFTAASSQKCFRPIALISDCSFNSQVGAEVAHSAHSDHPCGVHPLPCGAPQALPRTAQAPFSSAQRYSIRLDPSGSLPSYRRSPPGHSPHRPLEAGWDLLTHAQDRHGQGFSTLFFSSPQSRLVPSLVPSTSSETALPLPLWARNRWDQARPGMCACDCDLTEADGPGVQKLERPTTWRCLSFPSPGFSGSNVTPSFVRSFGLPPRFSCSISPLANLLFLSLYLVSLL